MALSILLALVVAVSAASGIAGAASDRKATTQATTLRLAWQAGGWSVAIDALIKNFQRVHPDIEIKTEYAPIATYGQFIQTQFQAGTAADLVFGSPGTGNANGLGNFWKANRLVDLSKEKWAKRVAKETWLKDEKGRVYGAPIGAFPIGVIYNKTLYSQLGLTIPKTFSGLVANCRKATSQGKTAFSLAGAFPAILAMGMAGSYVHAADPNWNAKRAAGRVSFASSPLWRRLLQRIVDMKNAGCFPQAVTALQIPQAVGLLGSQQAASYTAPGDATATIRAANPQLNLGMYAFPGDRAAATRPIVAYGQAIGINKASANIAAAKTFIAFAMREGQSKVLAHFMGVPTITEAKQGKLPSYMSDLSPYVKSGKFAPLAYLPWPNPDVYNIALAQGITGLLTGQLSIDTVLRNMDAAWNR
jgi:raffinose/stachyose/melibiose transport system substrate-binding protein